MPLHNFYLALPAVLAVSTSCADGNAPSSAVNATATSSINSADVFTQVNALSGAAKSALFGQIGSMTFSEYYDFLSKGVSATPVTIDGKVFTNLRNDLAAHREQVLSLDKAYANIGSLWKALGADPQTVALADFKLPEPNLNAGGSHALALGSCLSCITDVPAWEPTDTTDTPSYKPIDSAECSKLAQQFLGKAYVEGAIGVAGALAAVNRRDGYYDSVSVDVAGTHVTVYSPAVGAAPVLTHSDEMKASYGKVIPGSEIYLNKCYQQNGFTLPGTAAQ